MVFLCDFFWYNPMNTIHIWYIYLPLVDFYGKFHDSEHLFFCRSQGYSTVCPVGRRCACRGSEGLEVCVVKGDTVHLISMGSCHFLGVFFFNFHPYLGKMSTNQLPILSMWLVYLRTFTIKMYPNVGKYTSPLDGMGYLISKLQGFEDEVISVISIYISCHIYDSIFVFFFPCSTYM